MEKGEIYFTAGETRLCIEDTLIWEVPQIARNLWTKKRNKKNECIATKNSRNLFLKKQHHLNGKAIIKWDCGNFANKFLNLQIIKKDFKEDSQNEEKQTS